MTSLVYAQEIPPGTALPVTLDSTVDARKVKSGHSISATIEQDVPLPSGGKIGAGSRVNGQVLQAGVNSDGESYVRIRFDRLRARGRDLPLNASLRAVASWWEVRNALLPTRSPVRGENENNWTTVQVGGDVVYRGGGHVMHGDMAVGEPVYRGVLAQLFPDAGCGNGSGDRKLALWVFSSVACGAYGFEDLRIEKAAKTDGDDEVVLVSKTNVRLYAGSGMLLLTIETHR